MEHSKKGESRYTIKDKIEYPDINLNQISLWQKPNKKEGKRVRALLPIQQFSKCNQNNGINLLNQANLWKNIVSVQEVILINYAPGKSLSLWEILCY